MISRRGLALRWRIAVLSSLAIALLSIVASVTAFWVVRSSLIGDLQRALREDASRVASLYQGAPQSDAEGQSDDQAQPTPEGEAPPQDNAPTELPKGPTGGVIVQLYDPQGRLFAASSEAFETTPIAAPEVVSAAKERVRNWSGELAGRFFRAAIAPYDSGFVVVLASTGYIGAALRQISKALVLTALVLVLLSGAIGYLVAAAAMRPISQLASAAARLDPNTLHPIDYVGPKDEVGQLSTVLNELIVRLKASMDAQRTFLAETSHELRTPLTSLQGFLDRAVRRGDPTVRRELLDARRIARTMSRLVEDLLQLSRGELVREMVPHLLDPYSDILQPVSEEFPGVALEGEAGEILLGDPERLRQLIRNLTANAVRATGDPAKVSLRLEQADDELILQVSDQGPGIPAEALPNIFDKFYKGAGGGAGLGLAIAKQIADMHNGHLSVDSKGGEGTTFTLRLPRLAEDLSED